MLSFCHRLSLNRLISCARHANYYSFHLICACVGHYFPDIMRIDVEIVNSSLLFGIYSLTSIDLLLFVSLDTSTPVSVARRSKQSGLTTREPAPNLPNSTKLIQSYFEMQECI